MEQKDYNLICDKLRKSGFSVSSFGIVFCSKTYERVGEFDKESEALVEYFGCESDMIDDLHTKDFTKILKFKQFLEDNKITYIELPSKKELLCEMKKRIVKYQTLADKLK